MCQMHYVGQNDHTFLSEDISLYFTAEYLLRHSKCLEWHLLGARPVNRRYDIYVHNLLYL